MGGFSLDFDQNSGNFPIQTYYMMGVKHVSNQTTKTFNPPFHV